MKTFLVLCGSALAFACVSGPTKPAAGDAPETNIASDPGGVEFTKIRAGAHLEAPPSSLCELADLYRAGAGLYRVIKITSYVEEHPVSKAEMPFTYMQLELVEAWSKNAPATPTVRISGGATGHGDEIQEWFIEAAVGEELALMLLPPTKINRGFYGLHAEGVFKDHRGKGFNNGALFTDQNLRRRELGAQLGAAVDSKNEVGQAKKACKDVAPPQLTRKSRFEPQVDHAEELTHEGE